MSHFARVNAQGIVEQVIVAEQNFVNGLADADSWVQTSYNTHGGVHYNPETGEPSADQSKALRKNYAGVGYTYDKGRDAFIPPKPYTQWILDEQTCLWSAPTQPPNDSKNYQWDEQQGNWAEVPAQGE